MGAKEVILFDGDCSFCNRSVWFILKRDKRARFQFGALNSEIGQNLKREYEIPKNLDSFILLKNGRYYDRSSAALHVCKSLDGLYKLLYLFIGIPKPIRDFFYHLIAKNRHKIVKNNACKLPNKDERKRFLY